MRFSTSKNKISHLLISETPKILLWGYNKIVQNSAKVYFLNKKIKIVLTHKQREKNNMGTIIEISKKNPSKEQVLNVVLDGKHEGMVLATQRHFVMSFCNSRCDDGIFQL